MHILANITVAAWQDICSEIESLDVEVDGVNKNDIFFDKGA
jgi:hypothetical protein